MLFAIPGAAIVLSIKTPVTNASSVPSNILTFLPNANLSAAFSPITLAPTSDKPSPAAKYVVVPAFLIASTPLGTVVFGFKADAIFSQHLSNLLLNLMCNFH